MVLPDVLADDLAVVFCGVGTGDESGRHQAYYAGNRNKFWPVLWRVGLTPRQLRPEEYLVVPTFDIGLTDLARLRPGVVPATPAEDEAAEAFREKILEHRPAIVAFNGKEAAERVLGKDFVEYGRQAETIGDAIVCVLPSTSPAASDYWDESPWLQLAKDVRAHRRRR